VKLPSWTSNSESRDGGVPCGWTVLHGAIPGYGQRCKHERAASEDLVRHGCFQAEAFAAKDKSLCPFLVNGLKTAADVDRVTNPTDNRQYLNFVWKCD